MAGSYGHLRSDRGKFRFYLIDNMGDAHEACEHCFLMIESLTGGDEEKIAEAVEHAYELLRRGADDDRW